MGRFRQAMMALAAAALLTAPLTAQQGQGRMRGAEARGPWAVGGPMARNPVATLLERRDALELTADQVARLEAIQARVERENAPRIEELRAAFGDRQPRDLSAEERAQLRDRMQALSPTRDAIRETNRAAMVEARAILTPDQQAKVRQAMRRADGPRPGVRGPGGARPAMAGRAMPRPGWVVERVLDRRDELELTADQVTRLEAIRARLVRENEGRVAALQDAGERRAELVAEIRASHRAARDEVREILTDEQEELLRPGRR